MVKVIMSEGNKTGNITLADFKGYYYKTIIMKTS
jgi:hypothetical protein